MSNLGVRVLVALVTIPVIVFAVVYGGVFFFGFVLFISEVALLEYYNLVKLKGSHPAVPVGLIGVLCLDLIFLFDIYSFLVPFFILLVLAGGLVELFRKPVSDNWSSVNNLTTTLFPVFYIGLSLATFIGLRVGYGYEIILLVLASIWICDTAAYFVGVGFGKHRLYVRVSPKKTVEGFIAGFMFAVLTSVVGGKIAVKFLGLKDLIFIGLIVGLFGQLGDLVESLIKRDVGVKDSSAIIPGHGGMLDGFDSLIYVAPLVYLYLKFFI